MGATRASPSILAWAEIPLPEWVPWLGAVMVVVSFPLLIWVHQALGANFNTVLGVRDRHTLVTRGPYHWVRHPMYGVLFLFMAGLLLLTGNLLIGGAFLAGLLGTVGTRVAKEEAILEEEYGEEYRLYKARTGRFLPRLRSDRWRIPGGAAGDSRDESGQGRSDPRRGVRRGVSVV